MIQNYIFQYQNLKIFWKLRIPLNQNCTFFSQFSLLWCWLLMYLCRMVLRPHGFVQKERNDGYTFLAKVELFSENSSNQIKSYFCFFAELFWMLKAAQMSRPIKILQNSKKFTKKQTNIWFDEFFENTSPLVLSLFIRSSLYF